MSFPRLDILPPAQRRLWPQLAPASDEAFVLYGGTAIALHLGHRESVDFDFFSDRTFQPEDLLAKFRFLRGAELLTRYCKTVWIWLTVAREQRPYFLRLRRRSA